MEAAPENLQSQTSWVLFLAHAILYSLQIDGLAQNIAFRDSERTIKCYIRAQQFYHCIFFYLFINLVRVFERGVGATDRFFLRDAMRCTRNCLSYVPDIPVLITYARNRSDTCHWSNYGLDKPEQLYTIARALAAYAYTELGRT